MYNILKFVENVFAFVELNSLLVIKQSSTEMDRLEEVFQQIADSEQKLTKQQTEIIHGKI